MSIWCTCSLVFHLNVMTMAGAFPLPKRDDNPSNAAGVAEVVQAFGCAGTKYVYM